MPIYKIKDNKVNRVKSKKINLEKDIQVLTENNLETMFGLTFVSTEFALQNFRIDTLAYDENSNSFVIIEYKRDRSFSIVDQGFSYLSLLLNNKDSFILEFARKTNTDLDKIKIDWSQSRVMFVAQNFTTYQQNAINFKDLPIELWEVEKFEEDLILYNKLKSANGNESINKISKNKQIEKVSTEVRKYNVDDLFKENWSSREFFEILNDRILNLDTQINAVPTKNYIGYKIGANVLFNLTPRSKKLEIQLYRVRPADLNDPENVLQYIKHSMENWNKHVSKFYINSEDDIEYTLFLIKQIYKKFV